MECTSCVCHSQQWSDFNSLPPLNQVTVGSGLPLLQKYTIENNCKCIFSVVQSLSIISTFKIIML